MSGLWWLWMRYRALHVPRHELEQFKAELPPGRLRLRYNSINLGASGSRNRLMQESLAQLLVFIDDDVEPEPGCVPAYVQAFKQHPEEVGFCGPTLLPVPAFKEASGLQVPLLTKILALGVHYADVAFFWEAAAAHHMSHIAWGITANLAVRNTASRFDLRFPRTGGGEDVDFCLRLWLPDELRHCRCPTVSAAASPPVPHPLGLRTVPEAVALHPWWGGGRQLIWGRFWSWAVGDGELVDMYPALSYRAVPSGGELCFLLVCLGAAMIAVQLVVVVFLLCVAVIMSRRASHYEAACVGIGTAARACYLLLLSLASIFIVEAVSDAVREFTDKARMARFHSNDLLRLLASVYATSVRMSSSAGRCWGHFKRHGLVGAVVRLGLRMDWFGGLQTQVPQSEAVWALYRFSLLVVLGGAVWASRSKAFTVVQES